MELANTFLASLCQWTVIAVSAMAVFIVIAGTLEAFVTGCRWLIVRDLRSRPPIRELWIRYARWLVAALTFQLAADIVDTTMAPNLQDIARMAAIAAIRTFLNYFLERDLREAAADERVTRDSARA